MKKDLGDKEVNLLVELKQCIWGLAETLIVADLKPHEHYIILLYLSLYKDDLLPAEETEFGLAQNYDKFINSLSEDKKALSRKYAPIIQTFYQTICDIDEDGIFSIIVETTINKQVLSEYFSDIFDNFLYKITLSIGRKGGELIQPMELTRFIESLTKLPENGTVFNPFAGLASFAINLKQEQQYYGQELNQITWALAELRLMAHGKDNSAKIERTDSVLSWPDQSNKFDLIIANPPLGMRLNHQYLDLEPNIRTAEQLILEKGSHSLTNRGKLICLTAQGILFREGHEQRLRQELVQNDLLDSIIALPANLLYNSAIPLVILVLNKEKRWPGKVRFVDAQNYYSGKSITRKTLKVNELIELIEGDNQQKKRVKIVSNDVIKEFDYNLNVPRYFQKELPQTEPDEQLVSLGDILKSFKGKQTEAYYKKLIQIKDLKDDRINYKLELNEIIPSEVEKISPYEISESCLLLAIRWKKLKPTFFEYNGEPIYCNQDILSFRVNTEKINVPYLINELHSDYVLEQIKALRLGITVPYLRKDDLLSIKIKLPSLTKQHAKTQGVLEENVRFRQIEIEKNQIARSALRQAQEEFASIKHALGKPLLSMGSSLRNMGNAMSKINPDWQNIKLNERFDTTIKDTFDAMYENLEFIHSLLKNNDKQLDLTKYKLDSLDFIGFFKNYIKGLKISEKENVKLLLDIHPDIESQIGKRVSIKSNKELLKWALNTIVENANKHAFIDDSKKYKLEFKVSLYVASDNKSTAKSEKGNFDTLLKVEIANNGEPFPKNFSIEKLIRKNAYAGKTGNTGQGGYVLNEIIKSHNEGKSTLDLSFGDQSSEFKTTYVFLLPIIN